jgi:hypothetical protein
MVFGHLAGHKFKTIILIMHTKRSPVLFAAIAIAAAVATTTTTTEILSLQLGCKDIMNPNQVYSIKYNSN